MNTKRRILIVEDDVALVETLTDRLESENYIVRAAVTGDAGFEEARAGAFDLILLDLMLPGRGGLEVCSELRRRGLRTPILMLTARGEIPDRVLGLHLGGDDYLQKPFHISELMARIEALIRRSSTTRLPPAETRCIGFLEVDLRRGRVLREKKQVVLSAREWALFSYLVQHAGAVLSRDELLKEVWGLAPNLNTRTVDVHVAWLRQKLEANPGVPQLILTVPKRGYKLVEPDVP